MRVCDVCGACSDDQYELCAADGGALELLFPGPRILAGRYRLEQQLAQGAMGRVFLATHLAVGSQVAVKVMQPAQRDVAVAVQRFHKEARILGAVKHPNAVLITDFDVDQRATGAVAFLVTELLRGRSLAQLLDTGPRLSLDDVERIIVPLCEAVEEAHAQGIIHRDLKPANVFLERLRDGSEVVKVLDFGIAKLLSRRAVDVPAPIDLSGAPADLAEGELRAEILAALDDDEPATRPGRGRSPSSSAMRGATGASGSTGGASTWAGLMVGTVPYMATEQMTGERVTRRSDVHALAVMIFEMLAGQLPYDGDDDDIIAQKLADERPSLRELGVDVDDALDALLMRCFASDPEERPDRVSVLAAAVQQAAGRRRGAEDDPVGALAMRLSTMARALSRLEGAAVTDVEVPVVRDILLSAGGMLLKARSLLAPARARLAAPPQRVLVSSFVEIDDVVAGARTAVGAVARTDADAAAQLLVVWRQLDAFTREVGALLEDDDSAAVADPFAAMIAEAPATAGHTASRPWDEVLDALGGRDPLEASDACDAALDDRVDDTVRTLQGGGGAADRLIAGLWRFADVILLRDIGVERGALRFLPLLAGHPRDAGRFGAVMAGLRDRRGVVVVDEIGADPAQEPLLRCLLLHPIAEVRRAAAGRLPILGLWGVAAHPRTPLAALVTIFRELKKRGHPDHLKVFFFCVRDSLLSASTAELQEAVILVRAFFEEPAFHEDLLFEPLLEVERHLRERADAAGLLDESYARALAVFVGAGAHEEAQLEHLRDVPLALQRKLAREGRFLSTFVCHVNDRIAMETVPHLLRLDDITRFLRLPTLHRTVLVELAKRRRFFKKDAPKLALLAHPKTPAAMARAYIHLVADEQLRLLAQNRHINPEVRRLIQGALQRPPG
jgi:serine/threonine protein kinase